MFKSRGVCTLTLLYNSTTHHDLTLDKQENVYWSNPSVYIQTGVVDSTSALFWRRSTTSLKKPSCNEIWISLLQSPQTTPVTTPAGLISPLSCPSLSFLFAANTLFYCSVLLLEKHSTMYYQCKSDMLKKGKTLTLNVDYKHKVKSMCNWFFFRKN